MSYEPIRPFSPMQLKIADGIHRELSYKEIGAELGLTPNTVRQYVRDMSMLLDEPRELPPRWRILFWRRFKQWQKDYVEGVATGVLRPLPGLQELKSS